MTEIKSYHVCLRSRVQEKPFIQCLADLKWTEKYFRNLQRFIIAVHEFYEFIAKIGVDGNLCSTAFTLDGIVVGLRPHAQTSM